MNALGRCLPRLCLAAVVILGAAAVANAETPRVAFDLPFTVECRDVTPTRYEQNYRKKIVEAVVKISPQLVDGEEKDLKKLHYEISTEQQMPVISYAPSSQVTSDVAGGTVAIQTDDHHGQLVVHYLITPAAGDGKLTGDLNASHTQYTLLAPKQILLAAGTIERGSGVYFELKPSTQDTLQKQREFACLFEVPATWRADYITVKCSAKSVKHGLFGLGDSEVDAGQDALLVGLYKQDDGEAKELANLMARRQQAYLDQLAGQTKHVKVKAGKVGTPLPDPSEAAAQAAYDLMKEKDAQQGALAVRAHRDDVDRAHKVEPPAESPDAQAEFSEAKEAIRSLNGKL